MSNVMQTVAETITITTAPALPDAPASYKDLTLASPEVAKAVAVAVGAEDSSNAKWVSAASKLWSAGARAEHLSDSADRSDNSVYSKIRTMVVNAQKANIVTLLTAGTTIGFTDQERADRRYYKNRVDNVHMKRVKEHLAKIETTERDGANVKKTMGERGAEMCSDWIEKIQKAKPEKIDFDATEAIAQLRQLKEIFLS
jgi:hypothetical protein